MVRTSTAALCASALLAGADAFGLAPAVTRDPKPETRNPKPETRNPKPETRNPQGLSSAVPPTLCLSLQLLSNTAPSRLNPSA